MAQLALGVVGGVVGGYIGGPVGAQIGFAIGSGIGGLLFPPDRPTIEGPRLRDTAVQTSTDGAPIAEVWGTVRLAGNVFWSSGIVETRHEEDVGGAKGGFGGGGGATQVSYTYSVSLAIGVCEGPITGIRRIWADSKLIYSIALGATPETFQANTSRGTITFYNGNETQTADPTISAAEGAANTPGYRGTAYVVFTSFQLADFANHIPNFEFEVVKDGAFSKPFYEHDLASSGTVMEIDRRRIVAFYVDEHPTADTTYIYRWGFNGTAPAEFFLWTSEIEDADFFENGDIYGLTIQSDRDELVAIGGGVGAGVPYARVDISTGALLASGHPSASGTSVAGITEGVTLRARMYYDEDRFCFWGLGEGFSSGDLYVTRFLPQTEQVAHFVVDESGITNNPRHQLLRDASGNIWLASPTRIVKASTAPEVFTLPATCEPERTVLWAARQEIWFVRASGHDTNGWIVFDIATETFSNSPDLFGSPDFGAAYDYAVENQHGHLWLGSNGGNGEVNAILINTSGTTVDSISGEIDTDSTNWNRWEYVTGVVILNMDDDVGAFYEDALATGTELLSAIVTEICDSVGFDAIDVTDLQADVVRGYARTRPMTARQAIEPLAMAYGFDGVESDAEAKFVKRGGASAQTFEYADLGAKAGSVDDEPAETFTATTVLETELPVELTITFFNANTDHLPATARQRRLTGHAQEKIFTELPIVFTSEEANQVVDSLMRQTWVERTRFAFSFGPEFADLEPTDVVTLPDETRVRITRTTAEPSGRITCEAAGDDQGALTSYVSGNDDDPSETLTLGTGGPSVPAILDVVLLRDADDDVCRYVGACGESANWPGAVVYQSLDGGATWVGRTALTTGSKIGAVVDGYLPNIPVGEANVWDLEGVLTVKLAQPDLTLSTPASTDDFYQGANAFFIYDANGEHTPELCQGYDVTSNADGSYTIVGFLRGRKGTDTFIRRWGIGSRVVFVDTTRIAHVTASLSEIGATSLWKAVTSGESLVDEVSREREFNAVAATPLAPAHVGGVYDYASGNITALWTRRARKDGDWRSGGGAPLDEPTENYEVEVWDDGYSNLKETIEVAGATTATYTAAMNAADFGSPQAEYVALRVYQISSRIGRGFAGEGRAGILPPEVEFSQSLTTAGFSIQALPAKGRKIVHDGTASEQWAPCSRTFPTGKWYWELLIENCATVTNVFFGLTGKPTFAVGHPINTVNQRVWQGNGSFFSNGAGSPNTALGESIDTTSQVVRFAWDAYNGLLWVGLGKTWLSNADPSTGIGYHTSHTGSTAWRPVVASSTAGTTYSVTASWVRGNIYDPPEGFQLIR